MDYRKAEEKDLEAILDIAASAIAEMERHGIFQWDSEYPARADFLSDIQKGDLYIGMEGNAIAVIYTVNRECDSQYGNGAWRYTDGDHQIIHRLCVDPKWQNRGIAGKTLCHIENELRKEGIGSIRLDVFKDNPFALSLYLDNGYEKTGTAVWRGREFFLMEKGL